MEQDSHHLIRAYLAAFSTGDPVTIADHVSQDFVNEHTAALGSRCVGRAQYRGQLVVFIRDMVGLEYTIEELIGDGERVAVFYTMSARWQGLVPFTVRGVQRLVVGNNLITHRTDYWDSAVFLTQVSDDARKALAAFGIS